MVSIAHFHCPYSSSRRCIFRPLVKKYRALVLILSSTLHRCPPCDLASHIREISQGSWMQARQSSTAVRRPKTRTRSREDSPAPSTLSQILSSPRPDAGRRTSCTARGEGCTRYHTGMKNMSDVAFLGGTVSLQRLRLKDEVGCLSILDAGQPRCQRVVLWG